MAAARYIGLLMGSRNQAHAFHLLTPSYAQHKALQDYYEKIVDLLDTWAEAYMGTFGRFPKVLIPKRLLTDPKKALGYFRKLLASIQKLKLPKGPLASIQDDIVVLIRGTMYKLSLR